MFQNDIYDHGTLFRPRSGQLRPTMCLGRNLKSAEKGMLANPTKTNVRPLSVRTKKIKSLEDMCFAPFCSADWQTPAAFAFVLAHIVLEFQVVLKWFSFLA